MKYILKQRYVDAEVYKSGLEDGFTCIKQGCGLFSQDCKTCSWNTNTPFIYTYKGKHYINETDYILLDENDNKSVVTRSKFEDMYEVADN